MKTLIIALVGAVCGSAISLTMVGQAQTAKTPSAAAFISSNRLFTESEPGRSGAMRIQTLQRTRANELREKQQTLETTRQQMGAATDSAARLAFQQQEAQQRGELERSAQQAQMELQTLQREVDADVRQRVRTVLDELMKTQSYQLVLNSDASLMWSSPELDMTNAVIAQLNRQ